MKNAEQWCKHLNIELDVLDRADCRWLEKRGYEFLVDFGYGNAADKRDAHAYIEREQKTQFLRKDQAGL